jgi:hypothetical protein
MELEGRHILIGILFAVAIGAGVAWKQHQPEASRRTDTQPIPAPSATAAPALYKWRDDQGVWNYTDQPPADRPFERITGTPNVNSVPTVVPESGLVEPSAPPAQ